MNLERGCLRPLPSSNFWRVIPEGPIGKLDTSKCPEFHETEKKLAVTPQRFAIGDSLTWLENQGYVICLPVDVVEGMPPYNLPVEKTTNQWLADYFGIDLGKREQERMEILRQLAEGAEG